MREAAQDATPTAGKARLPRQIPYIIGNEACERFSFYGMRNILVQFLIGSVMLSYLPDAEREGMAKEVFHSFVIGVYFFPLLGGWLSDRFFGKYNTIFWLSLLYCVGHACLAVFEENRTGFYTGLFLIALGSGGIKPLVSAFVGDQFTQANKHLSKVVYDVFYASINFGSLFASLLMPRILEGFGPSVAFGIPGILMFIATIVFWMGRHKYVHIEPAPRDPNAFMTVVMTALRGGAKGEKGIGTLIAVLGIVLAIAMLGGWGANALGNSGFWPEKLGFVPTFCLALGSILFFGGVGTGMQLERARGAHPDSAVDGVRAVLRLLIIFAIVSPFWSLFDQKASTWVLQGKSMVVPHEAWWWPSWLMQHAGQMQVLNPIFVLLLIPFNNLVLYPSLTKMGFRVTPLRRMGWGIAFSGLAWVLAGMIQLWIDGGDPVSLAWQALPYVFLTFAEVLVSATGLEFAYSQAPQPMKGVIMSFWLLSVTFGNVWVLLTNAGVKSELMVAQIASSGLSENAFLMFFFAGFAFVAAVIFAWYAKHYPMQDYYRAA
jgi:POT family proton-dependent oligopeptide transporter